MIRSRSSWVSDPGQAGGEQSLCRFGIPGSPERVRGDLSATLFFSDPDLYDGGDLMIRGEFARHRVKLPAGHLVLYSARTLHQVTAVTRGIRMRLSSGSRA